MDFVSSRKGLTVLIVAECIMMIATVFGCIAIGSKELNYVGAVFAILGIILSFIGIIILGRGNLYFRRAFVLVIINICLYILSVILAAIADNVQSEALGWITLVIACFIPALNILVTWCILGGCLDICNEKNNSSVAGTCKFARITYIIAICIDILFIILANVPGTQFDKSIQVALIWCGVGLELFAYIVYFVALVRTRTLLK